MLSRQNGDKNLTFLFFALNLKIFSIKKQITIVSIEMQTQDKVCLCFTKINTSFFFWCTKANSNYKSISVITKLKINFSNYQYEMMNYY